MSELTSHQRLGHAIKALRTSYGIKQSELARRIDKTPQSLWKLEKGDSISTATLISVLDELNITDSLLELITTQLVPDVNAVKAIKAQSKRIKALQKNGADGLKEGSIASGIKKEYITNEDKPVPLKPEIDTTLALELLKRYPSRYYRVDESSYRELMEMDTEDLATITLNQRCISDFDHKVPFIRRTYFVTTLAGAQNTDLTWYVDNRLRNPNQVLNVVLSKEVFSERSHMTLREWKKDLREHFAKMHVFVDTVRFGKETALVSGKGKKKPVGLRYQLHFEDWQAQYLDTQGEAYGVHDQRA